MQYYTMIYFYIRNTIYTVCFYIFSVSVMTSYRSTRPLAKLKSYITGRNERYCLGMDIESSWTSPPLCDRALSHYVWLGMLTGNAVGSWVSRSRRASVSRASSPALPGSELDEGGGGGARKSTARCLLKLEAAKQSPVSNFISYSPSLT